MLTIKKCSNIVMLTLTLWLMAAQSALAQPISDQTAETVGQKVVQLVGDILQPLGAAVIFVAIVICAGRIILNSNNPRERADAIAAIPYIIGGGVLLGGAMLVAGFIMGLWSKVQ